MDKLKKIFGLLLLRLLHVLANILPKKKNNWVFGAWFGKRYSDNPKVFFEYVRTHHPEIDATWIATEPGVVLAIRELGHNAFLARSIQGIIYQLRADKAFICQSAHDDLFAPSVGRGTKVINLWHGLPIKKIMYDTFDNSKKAKNFWGKLEDFLTPYNQHRNDLLLATSDETQLLLANAFKLPKKQVVITGFPRNDVFQPNTTKQIKTNESYQCLYMPTFRGGVGSECDLFYQYGFDVVKMDKILRDNNISLILRLHPVNRPSAKLLEGIENASCISLDSTPDLYTSIHHYDALITDYSGGYLDFILSGKPILFAPFDLDRYLKTERNLYYDYKSVTLPPFSYNWDELLANIVNIKNGELSADYLDCYKSLLKRFHTQLPGNSVYSKNVFNAVIAL
ncbi:MAG: CDP-glycerol glycerophosphotransferase family protein [Paraglaciecola sp.]|nr:CDP-glycerol glycerophosphotransferase family protein [Paraglaciecola sp.]